MRINHQYYLLSIPKLCVLLCYISSSSPTPFPLFHRFPKFGVARRGNQYHPGNTASENSLSKHSQTNFYEQTLDHFNFNPRSYKKFRQYYVINSKYWGGANSSSPIFVYLGAESPLDEDIPAVGFLEENAPRFKALLVYIEHRFYGKSNPMGSMDKSLENKEIRGYFSSAQALADYAEILSHVKHKLSAQNSPVIVFGGSYGGMLASWFRLKYPHIALGALASSAPILFFDDITPQNGYYYKVSQDFKEVSETCYQTIRDSWLVIDEIASQPKGLIILSKKFNTCATLNNSRELQDFLDMMYSTAAQYNYPPEYPVTLFCNGVDEAPRGTTVIDRIVAGIVALEGNLSCHHTQRDSYPSDTNLGWSWQRCSEMVIPFGRGSNDTMFPAAPFILRDFEEDCKTVYGVSPRPHWITTYYGGQDIKLVLKKFGSNIIFSNGLKDPFSVGGVLENLSASLVAVYTKNGSHCLDILWSHKDDPAWLVAQRKVEVEMLESWIKDYYADFSPKIKQTNA